MSDGASCTHRNWNRQQQLFSPAHHAFLSVRDAVRPLLVLQQPFSPAHSNFPSVHNDPAFTSALASVLEPGTQGSHGRVLKRPRVDMSSVLDVGTYMDLGTTARQGKARAPRVQIASDDSEDEDEEVVEARPAIRAN